MDDLYVSATGVSKGKVEVVRIDKVQGAQLCVGERSRRQVTAHDRSMTVTSDPQQASQPSDSIAADVKPGSKVRPFAFASTTS